MTSLILFHPLDGSVVFGFNFPRAEAMIFLLQYTRGKNLLCPVSLYDLGLFNFQYLCSHLNLPCFEQNEILTLQINCPWEFPLEISSWVCVKEQCVSRLQPYCLLGKYFNGNENTVPFDQCFRLLSSHLLTWL